MAIPFSYSLRNLWTRRLTTILTAGGMALVVFVFAAILMLAAGLQKTLVEPDHRTMLWLSARDRFPRFRAVWDGSRRR